MATADITDVEDRDRFEARVGGELAGYLDYFRGEEAVAYLGTEVSGDFRGRGVGGELTRAALDDARRRGLRVRPVCSFVSAWIDRHPDYRDLVE